MPEPEPSPDSPPPRTTGGNWRWEPPSPALLEALLPGYTVERLLGRGGMGAVYKGLQASLERPVAIKILPSGIEREDPTYAERFRNEAKVMARLLHPAVVAVFDFGQTADGQLYFVMEYVDGTDIHGLIAARGRLPADHALAITAHVCDALAAAHALGIVHRDIKPSNVLINQLGQVKVADFGLAKVEEPGQHGLTRTGYALGTPDFVAPEALVLGASVDGRADLYAVGVMLYQMLTGDLPKGAWKAPSEKVSGLDPRFDAIVNRAMQSEPADRYQSAAELRRDLDVILTVPLVQADAPATSALPQQAVAGVAGKRSVAAKVPPPAPGKSGGRTPRQARHTAPVKPPAPAAKGSRSGNRVGFLSLGIGAVVLLAAGIFYAVTARGPVVQSAMAPPHLELVPPSVPTSEGPVTGKTDPPSSIHSTVDWNHPKLQHLESLPNGWGKAAEDMISIPGHAPDNLLGDVALRLRFRFEGSSALKFHIRSSASQFGIIQIKPTDIYIAYSDGRQSPPKIQTIKTAILPQPKAPNIESFLEIVLISQRVIVRIDNETLVDAEVADLPDRGGANLTFGGGLIRDFQKANLDGITDPLAALEDSTTHSPSQPIGDSLSSANLHPSTFGGYPAGLKVPIPGWLRKASEEGGRLEFIKTEGIPAQFDSLFDLGEAAQFDDFVAVYRAPYAWLAVRKNGDLWGRGWGANFDGSAAFGPIRSASIIRAWNPILVDGEGRLHSFPGGPGKPTQTPGISGLKSALGRTTSTTGSLHILLGSGNQTLETRNTQADTIPPPPDFFRDAGVVGASNVSFFAANPGQPLRGWDLKTGAPVPIENPPSDVVEIAGSGTHYTLLTSEGGVRVIHAMTGVDNLAGSKPPSTLGPALRVRNGGVCFLAQRTNGTWAAWQLDSDRQTSDRSDLISRIDAYGPALDLETGSIRVPGQELAGFWAIAIKPKSTAPPAAPTLTTNPAPASPPTSDAAVPVVPAWLAEARQRGGKVRFFGTLPKGATQRGRIEELTDVIDVEAKGHGVAARRANGETHALVWKADAPGGALTPAPFPTPALGGNSVLGLWSPGDRAFHQLWAGQFLRFREIDGTTAARSVSTHFHACLLDERGSIVKSAARPVADSKSGGDPPPDDFFLGATAIAGSQIHYFSAKPGQPVRSWNILEKKITEFPAEIRDVVAIQTAYISDHVVLLTREGRVFVTSVTGGARGDASLEVPKDLGPAIAIAAGRWMGAAQMTDGTWRAWGKSKALIDQVAQIGPAADVALDWSGTGPDQAEYLLWIEPPATVPTPGLPPSTQLTTSSPGPAQPTPSPSPQAPTPSDAALAADLLVKAKARGGRLRTVGKSRNGPFQISGPAATFDDFVQVSANHFGWAARRATGETHAGTWGSAGQEPYQPLGPYETTFLSRAAFIQMILADGTSRNVWSDTSQLQGAKPPAADRIVAVMNHVIRFEPDGKQHWLYGSASPEKPDFLTGGPLVTGTHDFFIRHRRGEPVASWFPKNGTEFTFPEDTRDTIEMDGGHDHVILLDARGKVQVWREDGKPLEAGHALRTGLPSDLDTFVAVRAGKGMSAAQRPDGTWVAWGTDATLAKEIGSMGKALDLDLFHDGEASFALWIEPSEDAARLTEATRLPEDVAKRLAEIEAQFQAAYDRDVAPGFHAAVTDLDAQYRAAVQRALDAAIAAGNLDESVKLRAEIQRLDAREPLPETDAGDLPETLRKLRATYRDTLGKLEADRAAKARPYHDRYDQLLDAYQKELTQQQRIDDALKVKARREVARPGGAAPSASAGPTPAAAAPTLASAPPPAAPPSIGAAPVDPLDPGRDLSKLPPWLQQAAKEGGKLRIWGTIKGTPIDEKQVLKDLRANDFTKVMTGESGLIFGMRQNGKGYHLAIDAQDPILNPVESGKIQSIDRTGGAWLADDFSWTLGRRSGNELKLGKDPIILGGGTGVLLIRLASNDWGATGYNWNNPADPSIQATMRAIGEQLKADEASVVATTVNSVHWITKDNRLRCHSINLRPGSSRELPVKTQPKEPIVELFSTSGRFGDWAARGMSGSVYSENTGGFDTPIADLSPAVAMRYSNTSLAIRAPDGAWRVSSTDQKLTEFIPTVGPAIDLDFYNNSSAETRIVLWIEADSSLKSR